MTLTRARGLATVGLAIGLAGALFLYHHDPAGDAALPPCPVLALTGLACPGCGTLRALHRLMHGDLAGAWHMNPMLIVLLPLLLASVLAACDFVVRGRVWRWSLPRRSPQLALVVLSAYMLARNV